MTLIALRAWPSSSGIGGDGVRPCLDLDGAIAAGWHHEFSDWPAGLALDRAVDRECRNTIVRCASIESRLRWQAGPGLQVALTIRKEHSISKSR